MSENKDNILEVDCPHCYQENKINLQKAIKCKHCEKPLLGEKYTKPIVSVLTAMIFGLGSGIAIDESFETDRYPISVEHSIIENCISSYNKPLKKSYYKNKRNTCICALKKTEDILDYGDYKDDQYQFLNIFEQESKKCN